MDPRAAAAPLRIGQDENDGRFAALATRRRTGQRDEVWPTVGRAVLARLTARLLAGFAMSLAFLSGAPTVLAAPALAGAGVVSLGGSVVPLAGGGVEVRAEVLIRSGYHINAHRPAADYLVPTDLSLTAPGATFGEPAYPEPVARTFPFSRGEKLLVYDGTVAILARSTAHPSGPVRVTLRYQACDDERCFPPASVEATLGVSEVASPAEGAAAKGELPDLAVTAVDVATVERSPWLTRWLANASLPAALTMMLVLGLTLNLTPCVYPLVSVTVAFFGSQAGEERVRSWPLALAYVGGITVSFAALGASSALFGGVVGAPLQHPAVMVGIASIFVALAASSFGLFEIRAPVALVQRFGRASGGVGGALLMGLTMGLIAAPCIGPVVLGLLLYVGAQRDLSLGFLLFLAMGAGMGLPYVALASAAGSIGRLPRAGEWLRWVNRLFGALLLGMALYFLAPLLADSVLRVAVPLYVALTGLYLGFVERSARDLRGFSRARRALGATAMGLAAWLALTEARTDAQARDRIRWEALSAGALDRAIAAGRPAIVEFSAEWCLPCVTMERTTFVAPEVTREAKRFSMLQVDVTQSTPASDALLRQFQVLGVPTIIFYDTRGVEVDRVVGYVGAERFVALMRRTARDGTRDGPAEQTHRDAPRTSAASG